MDSNSILPTLPNDDPSGAADPAVSAAAQTGQTYDDPSLLASQLQVPSAAELAADDVDLIEKEWVERAKKIVDSTIGDPYKQNKELNKVRADYIKKRYNKDIKLSKD